MNNDNRLSTDFKPGLSVHTSYEDFFSGLDSITSGRDITEELGNAIREYVLDYVRRNPLALNNFDDSTYVRNYIGRNDRSGWEAIVMSWKKGNRTAIHSHPRFASYTIADGEFLIEIFEPVSESEAKLVNAVVVYD